MAAEEEYALVWNVYSGFMGSVANRQSIMFLAGRSFDILSKWEFSFISHGTLQHSLAFKLIEYNGSEEIFAKVDISVKKNEVTKGECSKEISLFLYI